MMMMYLVRADLLKENQCLSVDKNYKEMHYRTNNKIQDVPFLDCRQEELKRLLYIADISSP